MHAQNLELESEIRNKKSEKKSSRKQESREQSEMSPCSNRHHGMRKSLMHIKQAKIHCLHEQKDSA